MTDIVVLPTADDGVTGANAVFLWNVTLPLDNQDLEALGLDLGVNNNYRVLGVAATLEVTDVPETFVAADWGVATGPGTNLLAITITTLPDANGDAITNVQYDVASSGTWISIPGYSGTGVYNVAMAAPSTSYAIRLRAVNVNGNSTPGNSESATSGAADVTAPVLSSPTGEESGTIGATSLGVTTDEASGILYWGIYESTESPTAGEIVAGTDATKFGNQVVTTTGAQVVADQTGLTGATEYEAYYVQDDASLNRSNVVVSAAFTTDAVGGTVGATATTDGTAYLSGTFPADFTDGVAWAIYSRSVVTPSPDLIDTANGKFRLIARTGGTARVSVSDTDTTNPIVSTDSAGEAGELLAVLVSVDAGVATSIDAMSANPGTWDHDTDSATTASLSTVDVGGIAFTIGCDASAPPANGFIGSLVRVGLATGGTVDITSATVRNALATSNGTTMTVVADPMTLRNLLTAAGCTILFDMYGGAARFDAATNHGSLTLTNTGDWT